MTKLELRNLWEARVAKYKASGQSAKVWCTENDVNISQLYYWLKKEHVSDEQPMWVPVAIEEPSRESTLCVRVGRASVELRPGFDPELLLKVVKTLSAVC
jgi:hypothetical protein